jgi:hypothetical protein
MKKIALILLIITYSLSIFGIGIRQFYCCGQLQSSTISFVQEVKEKCGKDASMSNCCKTKFKSLKIKDSHIPSDGITSPVKQFTDHLLFTPYFEIMPLVAKPIGITNASHAPPLHSGIPVYILFCTYRI